MTQSRHSLGCTIIYKKLSYYAAKALRGNMKNIQIIDGAENATFSIYQATEDEFAAIFPLKNQDVQFNDEIPDTIEASSALKSIWTRPVIKQRVCGIHGTIYYGFPERKEYFTQSRRWVDMDDRGFNEHERVLLQKYKAGFGT